MESIKLCGSNIESVESEKWLGDYLHTEGNSQSIITTVRKRYGIALSTILDIKTIVEDTRATAIGGIMAGLEVYEMCVIPFILNNSETWDSIPLEALKRLQNYRTHSTVIFLLHP